MNNKLDKLSKEYASIAFEHEFDKQFKYSNNISLFCGILEKSYKDGYNQSLCEVDQLSDALGNAISLIADSTEYENGNLYYQEVVIKYNAHYITE